MKISKIELTALLLCAVFLAFSSGWFLRGNSGAQPVQIAVQRPVSEEAGTHVTPAPTGDKLAMGEKININTADLQTLCQLPGIGEKRAQDILDYRADHGAFRIPEEITNVKGIGEGTLAGLIDFITTEEAAP